MQRQFRLRRSADFTHVRTVGRSWRHPLLTMGVVRNDLDYNRYGFIASRHIGGAVVRNQVRRRLREVVRLSAGRLRTGFDIVMVARNEIADQPYNKVHDALEELFRRAKLWKEDAQL